MQYTGKEQCKFTDILPALLYGVPFGVGYSVFDV